MKTSIALAALSILVAGTASAKVLEVTPVGFGVGGAISTTATPKHAYQAILHDVDKWWNAQHTYSGDSHNLSMASRIGGCFCEHLSHGGEVEHARVILLIPDSQIRLSGAFGPLQSSGLVGTLSFKITPAESGSKIEMTYNVGGYMHGTFENIASPVDEVLSDQLNRLKSYLDTGKPK
jgi:hypothetical protein